VCVRRRERKSGRTNTAQTPNSKVQIPNKHQAPNTKGRSGRADEGDGEAFVGSQDDWHFALDPVNRVARPLADGYRFDARHGGCPEHNPRRTFAKVQRHGNE